MFPARQRLDYLDDALPDARIALRVKVCGADVICGDWPTDVQIPFLYPSRRELEPVVELQALADFEHSERPALLYSHPPGRMPPKGPSMVKISPIVVVG